MAYVVNCRLVTQNVVRCRSCRFIVGYYLYENGKKAQYVDVLT